MRDWAQEIFAGKYALMNRWSQPFAVIGYCRMLHTLSTGTVESKPADAQWAKEALDVGWAGLIERAWAERPNPSLKIRQAADREDMQKT